MLNDHDLVVSVDDAVTQMIGVAAGEIDEEAMALWLAAHLDHPNR